MGAHAAGGSEDCSQSWRLAPAVGREHPQGEEEGWATRAPAIEGDAAHDGQRELMPGALAGEGFESPRDLLLRRAQEGLREGTGAREFSVREETER